MLITLAGAIGGVILDKIIDGTYDAVIGKFTKESIVKEYNGMKDSIYESLIAISKEECYFDSIQRLLDDSKIIEVLFNFSYLMTNLPMQDRKKCINDYIDSFYSGKRISTIDISIIKGMIQQQFDRCFNIINKPSEESRKIINQIVVQIADSNRCQEELLSALKCDIQDLQIEIANMKKLFPTGDVDLAFLKELTKSSIDNLQIRYNKEFNVDVELSGWLQKFCVTSDEKRLLFSALKEVQQTIARNNRCTNRELMCKWNLIIEDLLEDRSFDPTLLQSDIEKFINLSEDEIRRKYPNCDKDYYESNEYYDWRQLCIKNSNLDEYRTAFCSDTLVVKGEAGIGKSHTIAHFIHNDYYLQDKICVFILGQHLGDQLNPVCMIEQILHIPYTLQRFLEELNCIAVENNFDVPFVIEGINEWHHSEMWKEYYDGLVATFAKYTRIKLIISIRTTYIKKCLPEKYDNEKVLVIEHRGFADDSTKAVAAFFDYYGIDKPTFPILYSDFYNPLFLHTLCKTVKGSGNVKIDEYSSFSDIFAGYINVIEKSVSERCKYQQGLKLVRNSVDSIIKYSLEKNMRYGIKVNEFYQIVGEIINKFGVSLTEFIQALIESGLFYTDIYGYEEEEEYIQFAYERYHNILSARYLIADINSVDDLNESIIHGELSKYFANRYSGILEELFVLVPEKYDVELLEIFDEEVAKELLDPFLNSLIWRKTTSITLEKTKDMVNNYIVVRPHYFKKLIEKQLIIAPIEGHPLNAIFLHEYLGKQTMAQRDRFWVECLHDDTSYGNGILNILVKLIERQQESYSYDTKVLIGILLSWSLASTNNIYRESAVRSLVTLLQDDLTLATELIKKFAQVDDGYVKEGLYCSVYGAVLRSLKFLGAEDLATTVFENVFDRDEDCPHIIVRAHAKGIIDYLINSGMNFEFDVSKTVPPYSSKWYDTIAAQEEIDKYIFDYKDNKFEPCMYSSNQIIYSMVTNTGKKSMMYGDFGRYVFEGWVRPWVYHFIAQDLSNIVVKQIFEKYGYDYNLHGEFDRRVKSDNRNSHKTERIGKKYQRIASFEMLARLADNFSPGEVEREYSNAYSEWSSKRFEEVISFNKRDEGEVKSLNNDYEVTEDDIKEVFIPYLYEGPWQFGHRGIDPTVLAKPFSNEKNLWENILKIPNLSNLKWASKESCESELEEILFVEYDNDSYVTLEMYTTWKSDCLRYDENPKEYFVKAVAVLNPVDNVFDKGQLSLRKYAEGENNYDVYNIFAREYFWSDAYKNFEAQVEKDSQQEEKDGYIATGIDYKCPMSFSGQVEDVISSYAMPSKYIVDCLQIKQLQDGKWFDESGKLVCLDIKFDGYQGALIIRKDKLFELMKDKKLEVAWGIYTEKKGLPYFYATRKTAKWNGQTISIEEYDTEQWTSMH